jgi:SseB protein N-terminal domain
VVDLSVGDARYRADHGAADPAVAIALAAYAAGTGGEHAALSALAGSRLLVPVVAVPSADVPSADVTGADRASGTDAQRRHGGIATAGDKASEMALPKIIGRDGRQAMLAFTSLAAVQQWRSSARPVPVPATVVWQSAMQESCAVVIDIAGPVPIVVEGSRLAALAAGGAAPAMHEDPDVWRHVAAAAAEVAPGIRVRLSQPNGGLDFTLELAPPPGSAGLVPEDVASRVADAVHDRLPGRIRAGIAVLRRPG